MSNKDDLGGRLPLLKPDTLPPDARALYDRLAGGRLGHASPFRNKTAAGELIGPFNVCLHSPTMGAGFLDFHEAEERATPLSARIREVVILSVGAVWEASYLLYAHQAAAQCAGMTAGVAAALASGDAVDALSREEQLAQQFTLELARYARVGDATYAACEAALGREGVIALVFLAAAYAGTGMVLNAFAIPAPGSGIARDSFAPGAAAAVSAASRSPSISEGGLRATTQAPVPQRE